MWKINRQRECVRNMKRWWGNAWKDLDDKLSEKEMESKQMSVVRAEVKVFAQATQHLAVDVCAPLLFLIVLN